MTVRLRATRRASVSRGLRALRDRPAVLSICVHCLRALRAIGLLRSSRVYAHVPYRGIVRVDCGNGRSFRIESRGHAIENGLYWDGLRAHEPKTMATWVEQAHRARTVLDIGANSGVFALAAAAAGAASVHAFEPLPRMSRILASNLALNGFGHVRAWPLAVGASEGVATIFDPGGEAPASASLSAEFSRGHFGELPGAPVRVVGIDELCETHAIGEIDLVKIDVEGYESHVLRGMQETVTRWRPLLVLEVLDGHEEALRDQVESQWPGQYSWVRIDEGRGLPSRNVLLSPTRA